MLPAKSSTTCTSNVETLALAEGQCHIWRAQVMCGTSSPHLQGHPPRAALAALHGHQLPVTEHEFLRAAIMHAVPEPRGGRVHDCLPQEVGDKQVEILHPSAQLLRVREQDLLP